MKSKLKICNTIIKSIFKNHIKFVIGFLIGISLTTGVYAAIKIPSSHVSYDNTASGLNSSNVQDAIDKLKTKVEIC